MAVRDIIKLPDPLLKTVSRPVDAVTDEVRQTLSDMLETMYAAPGIGLAAIQIGDARRMIVIDVAKDEGPANPLCLINPQIIWQSEQEAEYEEGCLSIPDVFDKIVRPSEVRVRFLDRDGQEQEMDCEGLLATCVQHEIDHLNGVLFIDYLSRLKRDRVVKKFAKAARQSRESA